MTASSSDTPADTLAAALARHGITLEGDDPQRQLALLDRYGQLLWEWNEKINLTRHTDYERFVSRDLVDSLAFARFLKRRERVLDVGTGGGVPGIVLAIVRGDLRLTLAESVAKKARVVEEIAGALGVRAAVHHGRAEELLRRQKFDALVIRAVAPLRKLLTWFQPHWGAFGRLLILKGPAWVEERGEARHFGLMRGLALRKLISYPLPGTHSESVLLMICPEDRLSEYSDGQEDESSADEGERSSDAPR